MRSIIEDDLPNRCYLCSRYGGMHIHHMLHGAYRKAADRYGLTVHLCPECHRKLHDTGVNDLALEQIAQAAFEKTHTREEFMEIFGRSWL